MKRLTNKKEADAQRREYENRLKNGYPRNIPEERFLKLAAYEDTGLEPEEILGLCSMSDRAKMADLLRLEEYQALSSIDHLREIVQAEKEGRLMVLPCLKGVPLYVLTDDGIERTKCRKIVFMERSGKPFPVVIAHVPNIPSGIAHWEIWNIDFGKTVFLTRAEAEAALKKEEKNNEAD